MRATTQGAARCRIGHRERVRAAGLARPAFSVPLCLCGLLLVLVCGAAAAQTRDREWPTETPPRPLPARDSKFPPYELQTLTNGLQVVAILHHEQPAVTMRLLIRAGTSSDPKGKLGLAHLVASLLDQGTKSKSAESACGAPGV